MQGDQEKAMLAAFQKSREFLMSRRSFLSSLGVGTLGLLHSGLQAEETKMAALIDQAPQTHALIPALKMALVAQDAVALLKDYETTFTKIELVGRKTITSRMLMKVRHQPFSVYIKYLDPHAGREAIYVEGRSDNRVLVHDTGLASLVGTLSLEPTCSTAMDENRHPITKAGMKNLVDNVLNVWMSHATQNVTGITVNHYPKSKIGDQACETIETVLAQPIGSDSFHTTRLYVDATTKLPVRVQQYAFPARRGQKPALVEDYLYQNIKANVSLTELEFDVKNPRYGY